MIRMVGDSVENGLMDQAVSAGKQWISAAAGHGWA